MDSIELAAGRDAGSTSGPLIPRFDYLWDFMYGTAADLNMSRIVEYYENNSQTNLGIKPWTSTSPTVDFKDYYPDHMAFMRCELVFSLYKKSLI